MTRQIWRGTRAERVAEIQSYVGWYVDVQYYDKYNVQRSVRGKLLYVATPLNDYLAPQVILRVGDQVRCLSSYRVIDIEIYGM